jgi:hypothetical protein
MVILAVERGFVLINYCCLIWVTHTSIMEGLRPCLMEGEREEINTPPLTAVERN